MKKITAVIIALIALAAIMLSAASCSEKAEMPDTAENTGHNAALAAEGLERTATQYTDEKYCALYTGEGKTKILVADLTKDEHEKLTALDIMDDDYDAQTDALIDSLSSVHIDDVTDKIPTSESLSGFCGKKFSDLEAAGYDRTGYVGDEGAYRFTFDGPECYIEVEYADNLVITDMDDYSENDIRALTVGTITVNGPSSHLLDAYFPD